MKQNLNDSGVTKGFSCLKNVMTNITLHRRIMDLDKSINRRVSDSNNIEDTITH